MAEVTVKVEDLYRMIGQREVVIERLHMRIADLEKQVAMSTLQCAQAQAVSGDGRRD